MILFKRKPKEPLPVEIKRYEGILKRPVSHREVPAIRKAVKKMAANLPRQEG